MSRTVPTIGLLLFLSIIWQTTSLANRSSRPVSFGRLRRSGSRFDLELQSFQAKGQTVTILTGKR